MFSIDNTPIYCLSLRNRQDRRDCMAQEFARIGLDYKFINAIQSANICLPELGVKLHESNYAAILACAMSHRMIIDTAINEYIIIFEDDIRLSDDFLDRLKYIEALQLDFDMMYLGGHFNVGDTPTPTKDKYIHKINKGVAGTYGYIIKTKLSEFIERNYTYNYGIDEFFSAFVQPRFNCYIFIPTMVEHLDGYSDVALHNVEYFCNVSYQKERLT